MLPPCPPVYCGNVPTTTTTTTTVAPPPPPPAAPGPSPSPSPSPSPASDYVNQNPSDWLTNSPTYVKTISGGACDIATVTGVSINDPNICCQECAALNLPELSHITYDKSSDLCKCQKPFMENCVTTATDSSTKTKFCFDSTGEDRNICRNLYDVPFKRKI